LPGTNEREFISETTDDTNGTDFWRITPSRKTLKRQQRYVTFEPGATPQEFDRAS
jgi:hypothetical protein